MSNRPLIVALHPSVKPFAPEAKYVLRTLLTVAGYPWEFRWAAPEVVADIHFGPDAGTVPAPMSILSSGDFRFQDRGREPQASFSGDGLQFLAFDHQHAGSERRSDGAVLFHNDLVRACYWLLTGAMDAHYARDHRDNLQIQNSFLVRNGLLQRPLVSEYAAYMRRHFSARGRQAAVLPWAQGESKAAFVFSHDVDYPQMIKWIECARLLRSRGLGAWPSIREVLAGRNHFWQFANWVELEKKFGTRPAFYFSPVAGSLPRYAGGTPEVFYDIASPAFRDLFKFLRDEGCEIGLHASYRAHEEPDRIAAERRRLQEVSGAPVEGNRHHYWRLNPAAPEETLQRHEAAGFTYDSSLGFELFPGWRRGICHPFHIFHPGLRRELDLLQLPPAWMDDHFDRRLAINKIPSPDTHAATLLAAAASSNGIAIVDYHARGLNADFFPRYGPWLAQFLEKNLSAEFQSLLPVDVAAAFAGYEGQLRAASADHTEPAGVAAGADVAVRPFRAPDIPAIAALHYEIFGDPQQGGNSVAMLGTRFLERVFYGLNLDNPSFFCDVAEFQGRVIGFSVFSSQRQTVFRPLVRQKFMQTSWECAKILAGRPALAGNFLSNLRYLGGEPLPEAIRGSGWWIVAGVRPEFRQSDWEVLHGGNVASRLFDRMEDTLRGLACEGWYGVVRPGNVAINRFLQRRGAQQVAQGSAQGLQMLYYYKSFAPAELSGKQQSSYSEQTVMNGTR